MKPLLTIKEVAELINCPLSTIYAWSGQGEMPSYKVKGLLRFDAGEIEEWIKQWKVKVGDAVEIRTKHIGDSEIDGIIRGAIASAKKPRYNPSTKGKPDQLAQERRDD